MNEANDWSLYKQPIKDLNDVYCYKLLVVHVDNETQNSGCLKAKFGRHCYLRHWTVKHVLIHERLNLYLILIILMRAQMICMSGSLVHAFLFESENDCSLSR